MRRVLPWTFFACAADGSAAQWHMAASDEPAALLSVWGTSASDVWVTGGRRELAGGPTLLHDDGKAWSGQRSVTTPDVVIAVRGCTGLGEIVEHTAACWTEPPSLVPAARRGVAAGADHVYAVGESGAAALRAASTWSLLDRLTHPAQLPRRQGRSTRRPVERRRQVRDTAPHAGGSLVYYGAANISEITP